MNISHPFLQQFLRIELQLAISLHALRLSEYFTLGLFFAIYTHEALTGGEQ